MEKIKTVVNSPLAKVALAVGAGTLLLFESDILYAGIAYGIGVREFFLAFKKEPVCCEKNK